MIVGIKDGIKLLGISIVSCCAVFVCTLFFNYNLDMAGLKDDIVEGTAKVLYDAQISTGKVVCAVSGGCLLLTSVIMLVFYIKYYVDAHGKELGILKALGYSGIRVAKSFWVFGLSVLWGTLAGFCGAFGIMPYFYRIQNDKGILPDFEVCFHFELALFFVILPTIVFSVLAIAYSYFKLRCPALELMRKSGKYGGKMKRKREKRVPSDEKNTAFLQDLKKSTLKERKSLVFFMAFAAFCYGAMMQMSFSMEELASKMMSVMILTIGVILACTTLFLAVTTLVNAKTKSIAMMRAMGYSLKECCQAVLNGYRPVVIIGFLIGTVYQYVLLRMVVDIIFKDLGELMPEYQFDVKAFVIAAVTFLIFYEGVMYWYSKKINKISLKEIMME